MAVTKTIYWMRKQTVEWRRKQNKTADRIFFLAVIMAACTIGFFFRVGHLGYTNFGLPRIDIIDLMLLVVFATAGALTIPEAFYYKKCKNEYQTAKKALVDRLIEAPCTCTAYCTCAQDFIEDTYKEYKINLYYY